MTRRPAKVTQTEITRAIRAAAEMGPHATVEISPEGTIRIYAAAPVEAKQTKTAKRNIQL